MTGTEKKLTRSNDGKVIAGVCSGLGKFIGVDPVIVRIIFGLFTIMGGAGIIIYIILALVLPDDEGLKVIETGVDVDGDKSRLILGLGLFAVAAVLLAGKFFPWFDWKIIGAVAFIGLGAYLLIKGRNNNEKQ